MKRTICSCADKEYLPAGLREENERRADNGFTKQMVKLSSQTPAFHLFTGYLVNSQLWHLLLAGCEAAGCAQRMWLCGGAQSRFLPAPSPVSTQKSQLAVSAER